MTRRVRRPGQVYSVFIAVSWSVSARHYGLQTVGTVDCGPGPCAPAVVETFGVIKVYQIQLSPTQTEPASRRIAAAIQLQQQQQQQRRSLGVPLRPPRVARRS